MHTLHAPQVFSHLNKSFKSVAITHIEAAHLDGKPVAEDDFKSHPKTTRCVLDENVLQPMQRSIEYTWGVSPKEKSDEFVQGIDGPYSAVERDEDV